MSEIEQLKLGIKYKKELIYSIIFVSIGLSVVICFNGWYDPDGVYRARYASFEQIDGNGIEIEFLAAKYLSAEVSILGSSLSHRAEMAEQQMVWGAPLKNLAGAHNHASEQQEAAKLAIASGSKVILWEILFNVMKPVEIKKDLWIYNPSKLEQIYYLRDSATLRKSLTIAGGWKKTGLDMEDLLEYHRCNECKYGYNELNLTTASFLTTWNKGRRFENISESSISQSIRSNILPIIRSHPNTVFKLFLPPVSIFGSIEIDRRMQIGGFSMMKYRDTVFSELIHEKNVEIYDFQSNQRMVENMDNYSDLIHYKPSINTKLIEEMRSGRGRLTMATASTATNNFNEILKKNAGRYSNFLQSLIGPESIK